MNAATSDPAHEPLADLTGFEAELAGALEDFDRQIRPHEFDSHAIARRAARRRSTRVLAASAASLAVIAGATAFATHAKLDLSTHPAPPSTATTPGTDPLIAPATFRTVPEGGTAASFTELGATTFVGLATITGGPGTATTVQTEWTADGVDLTAQVSWYDYGTPNTTLPTSPSPGTVVGTVNGHPAYYFGLPHPDQLTFWAGSQGYTTATIFTNGELDQSATVDDLLSVAKSLDTTPAEVPMPIRITGLTGLTVADTADADMGWIGGPMGDTHAWAVDLRVTIDGRSYDIEAVPGIAATPTPTGTETTTGLVNAAENVDDLGITVSTDATNEGSPNAPTAAQVLAHITSLGTNPSNWTTNVIVK